MIVIGSVIVLAIFLVVGWAIFTEMFQHRAWRNRVASGDTAIVAALIEEALTAWRRQRPPRGTRATLWAGIQGVQLIAVDREIATVSSSAEGEFRTEGGQRVQLSTALDEAIAIATKLADMMLYDVPNLQLPAVRVDIYATFPGSDGLPIQKPILTTTASRAEADALTWETLEPEELLAHFETSFDRGSSGQGLPIELPPIIGEPPVQSPGPNPQSAIAEGA